MAEKGAYWDDGAQEGVVDEPVAQKPALPPCDKERTEWAAARRQTWKCERDLSAARERLENSTVKQESAARDLARWTETADRQSAQTRFDEDGNDMAAAQQAITEGSDALSNARMAEEAARKALQECEQAAGAGQ